MRIACIAAAIVTCLATPNAFAQASPATAMSDPGDARARALFFEGVEALEHGNHSGALTSFRASFDLRPRPITMLNIAQAYRLAGQPTPAIQSYEQYLVLAGDSITRDRVAEVRDTIVFVRQNTAWITARTQPDGATVRLDGRLLGSTPLASPEATSAGEHEIVLERDGYVPVREHVTLAAGQRLTLRFQMARVATAASLTIGLAQSIPGARIAVDGVFVGAPPVTRQVEPGGHRVEADAPGRTPYRAEIVLAPNQHRSLVASLERPPPVYARPWIWIVAGVVVAGAAVTAAVIGSQPPRDPTPGDLILVGSAMGR